MRIVVPIKQVPETSAVKMDERTGTMIREGVEAIINPLDLYAIELAIRLRESRAPGSDEVIVISMGPPKAMTALREAVAMGCDRAVLVSDKAFAGSDTWATAYVLAAAIRKLCAPAATPAAGALPPTGPADADRPPGPLLVICGERATDGDTGQVGPGIASFLDLPLATYVSKLDDLSDDKCRVHRLVEDGYEVLELDVPCLLTVVKEASDPRLPTLRGKQRARRAEVPVWGPADLDVSAQRIGLEGSPTRVVRIFRPQVARQCRKVAAGDEASVNAAADTLVEFLRERRLI